MHLNRLKLDLRSTHVRRDLTDPYEMHRSLVRAYVRDPEQIPPRILWRVEPMSNRRDPEVLVQSLGSGNWAALQAMNYFKSMDTRKLNPEEQLQTGDKFRFRLFSNPTVTREGRRQGLVSEDSQLEWLSRQGERFGFSIESALVTASEMIRVKKGETRISLLMACFEGWLSVRDPVAVTRALQEGIGPGKALGCGLLSLKGL